MEKLKHIAIFFLLAGILSGAAAPAKEAGVLLQEGLYAEQIDGDLDAAIKIYEKIIQGGSAQRSHVAQALYRQGMCYLKKQREQQAKLVFEMLISEYSDQTKVVNKTKPLLQDLGNADPAALMPAGTLVYLELGSPGKQIETILNMLEGTPLENPLAAIGGQSEGGPSPGNIVAGFLNPNMMTEFKKVRGAGIGITGIAEEDPPVIVVLFPGKSDALKGLIAGGLALLAKPVDAIEGMQTVEFTDGGGAAYDDTVVILASPPAYKAGQLTWCVKQYKGVGKEPTLASSNRSFTKISKKNRQENALTIWANVDRVYSALTDVFPEGQVPDEILHANGLADFGHIDDLIAFLTLEEDGVALEANIDFKDGYNSMAYNLFRTPAINRAALEVIPSEAVGILSVALNGLNSPQSRVIRERIRNETGFELGGDIFVNIEQVTLFAVPSAGTSMESHAGMPPVVGSLGLALRSPNPKQTRQILTGVLTAANLVSSKSAVDQSEQNFGRYQIKLVNDQTIHCYTDQKSKTTILSLNPNVVEASVSTLARRSAMDSGPLKDALNELSPDVSKLVMVNVGGAMQAGGVLFNLNKDDFNDEMAELFDEVAKNFEKTTFQLHTLEKSDNLNFRVEISDLPPAEELFGPMMQFSQMVSEAKKKAWSEKKEAGIPANIRKASRPVVIDGKAEALWSKARQYKIGNVVYSPIASGEDFSASYKALWDAQNLYVLVDVIDDSLKNDSDEDWLDDSVEVFIDADNSRSGSYGDNDYQFFFNWDRDNPTLGESRGRTGNVDFAVQTKDDGYQMEIKFPWSTLGAEPSVTATIGLDVHVNDDDNGGQRDTKLTWRDKNDSAWQNTKDFGIAELSGLIAWWKLDESGGRDVADASGNGNVGKILNGQPQWQTSGGKIGGALLLDGKGDWVHIANESKFDCTAEVTVAAWIKVNRFDKEWQAIVTKGDSAWRLQRNQNTDTLEFACSGLVIPSGDQWGSLYGNSSVNDGRWHHVAGVYDGRNMSIYVDGQVDSAQPASGPIGTNDHPVYLGENAEMTGRFWNGLIDDVRVYNLALDQAGIEALYNEGK